MVKSRAATVEEYLDSLPEDRRAVVAAVREVILKNLPAGYQETMNWGVISYEIPLERYPKTYNKQPLMYAGLAAQKNYFAVYLMTVYSPQLEAWFREEFKKAGKKLDMGKACVRFRKLDDLPLDVIGQVIARTPPEKYIAYYEASRPR
jgi:hypothetical protein